MNKHTPGPWRTGAGQPNEAASVVYAGPVREFEAGRAVAVCYTRGGNPVNGTAAVTAEDRANAERIVRAVNAHEALAAACKAALAFAEAEAEQRQESSVASYIDEAEKVVEALLSALAQAEGA